MIFPKDSEFKEPPPRDPAPRIDPVFVWPTPNYEDYLFYVERNGDLPINQNWVYGTPHPDATTYPDHRLVYVSAQSVKRGKWSRWYYAAERILQDEYNWSTAVADIGGTKFDAVTREYVVLRKDFDPINPLMGAAMPDVPTDKFGSDFVLSQRQQLATPDQELNSIFVFERRTYVKRATISDVKMNDETGRVKKSVTNLYYKGETVSGTAIEQLAADPANAYWGQQTNGVFRELNQLSDNWFAIIESNVIPENSINSSSNPARARVINRVTPLGTDIYFTEVGAMPDPIPTYGDAHYDSVTWPDHRLTYISPEGPSGLLYKFHYVADRENQDEYNWEISTGEELLRTYIIPKASYPDTTPIVADADIRFPQYGFADESIIEAPEELRSRYVALKRRYIEPITVNVTWSDSLKSYITITKEIIPAGSLTAANLASLTETPGTKVEVLNGNTFHDVKITTEIFESVAEPREVASFPSLYDKKFPSKLDSFDIQYAWAFAVATGKQPSFSQDYYFDFKTVEPKLGPYPSTIKTFITDDPQSVLDLYPLLVMPQPVSESVSIVGWWWYASTETGCDSFAVAKEVTLESTIHGPITITYGGVDPPPSKGFQSYIRTTDLVATPNYNNLISAGEFEPMDYQVKRLDLYLYEVTVVLVDLRNLYDGPSV